MNIKAWVDAIVELVWRIGLRFALWAAMGYFVYRVRSVIVFIIMAAVLTYAIIPIVDFLCLRRIPGVSRRLQRLMATLLVFLALGAITATVIGEFAKPFKNEFIEFCKNSTTYIHQLRNVAGSVKEWYQSLPQDAQGFMQQNVQKSASMITSWSASVSSATMAWLEHLVELILIPVLAFYFTLDSRSLKREFVAIVPRRRAREAIGLLHELDSIMRNYVIGQIILCIIAGALVGAVMAMFHLRYIMIMSVFAGITRAVPVVGPLVSGIAIVLLGTAQSPVLGLKLLIFFSLLQFVESKFIMPKLIGDRMQLHPAIVIVVLLVGAEFFGIFGMFMAAPVAALIRVLIRYYLIKPRHLRVWGLSHGVHRSRQPIDPL